MSTTVQSITVPIGTIVPATCDHQTDLALLSVCVDAYHTLAGGTVALATVQAVMDAMRDNNAIVTLYCDGKAEVAARCLWPAAVSVTKEKNLVTRAFCTLRKEWRTFRLDRMIAVHPLTTPDDAEPHEDAATAPDPVKMVTRLGTTLTTLEHNAHLDAVDAALLSDAIDDTRRLYRAVALA